MIKYLVCMAIMLAVPQVVNAAVVTDTAKTTVVSSEMELTAKVLALSNTSEAFICKSANVNNFIEKHDTSDPEHHTWEIRSKKTGKAITLHFYPKKDGVKHGIINADALEK